MLTSGTLIFVAFFCALGGFLLGALIIYASGSGRRNKPKAAPRKEAKEVKEVKEVREVQEGKEEQPKSPYQEIVRLVRDPATGKILTEMNGQILPPSKDLDEERRKMLLQLAREWVEWLGVRTQPQPVAQAPQPVQAPAPTPPPLPTTGSLLKRAAASAALLNPQPAVEPIPAVPVLFPAKSAETRVAPKSIVMQIDEILQEMLVTNSMQHLAIRLAEEPQHGVIVWVATTRFIGIDSVTDPKIKAVVRAAVAEWERRSEKG